ncbi:MAG: DUF4276 family protein [Anaerolineae bacterium]|nr:DUF4276 family protein [Anaerolineae bacterium]
MTGSKKVVCFFEDIAHEKFISALIRRAAEQLGIPELQIKVLNATQGSKVWPELTKYLRRMQKGEVALPDVLVVVIDGNCKRMQRVRRQIQQKIEEICGKSHTIKLACAVPEPHIERWYLEDQHALKSILPGAQPRKLKHKHKCKRNLRNLYKRALIEAIRAAGVEPLLGGAEYGEDIAISLNTASLDRSFQAFWAELQAALK